MSKSSGNSYYKYSILFVYLIILFLLFSKLFYILKYIIYEFFLNKESQWI